MAFDYRITLCNSFLFFFICITVYFKRYFYYRLVASGQRPNVNAEQVLWQLVRLFTSHDDPTLKTKVNRLAKALIDYQPDFYRLLSSRRKALDRAIQGKLLICVKTLLMVLIQLRSIILWSPRAKIIYFVYL